MIDADLIGKVFELPVLFATVVVTVVCGLWLSLRALKVQPFHPFAYMFYFNTGTAYGVAAFFALNFRTNGIMLAYVCACVIITVVALRAGYSRTPSTDATELSSAMRGTDPRGVFIISVALSAILFVAFAVSGVNTIETTSRFEAASGAGVVIRPLEAFTTIAMCYSALLGGRSNRKYLLVGVLLFAASQVFVAGSKAGVLEALLWYVFLSQRAEKKVSYVGIAVGGLVAIGAFLFVLYHNISATGIDVLGLEGTFSELPALYERAFARIIGNGDSYYFSLPPEVESHVSVAYGPLQMLFQLFGGISAKLFGVDVHNNEPGRQMFLYWYPDAPMGGAANRLDLGFYFYVGPVLGMVGVGAVAFAIGATHGIVMKSKTYTARVAAMTVVYSRLLIALLGPSIAFQRLGDCLVAMLLIGVLQDAMRNRKREGVSRVVEFSRSPSAEPL